MFAPAPGGGGGLVLTTGDRSRRGPAARAGGSTAAGESGEPAAVIPLADLELTSADERLVRQRARAIAARLAVPRPRRDTRARRGLGELESVPYRAGSDDIDLDRTLDVLASTPTPADDDIVVRERERTRRSVVLVVDVSGSMRGERVRTAAATVGALAGELHRDRLAVVAFWSDAALLVRLGEPVPPRRVLDLLLRIPARGLTNVAFALQVAGRQLVGVPPRDARVLLLSDCVHNAGPDPRPAAARLPRLDVLLDVSGEDDVELGRDLARLGRGRFRLVRGHRDVAPALTSVFSG
ncbi:vWA domain-containing protein [Geodermatophilus sp. URMC 60]